MKTNQGKTLRRSGLVALLAVTITQLGAFAENKISLQRVSQQEVSVEFSNSDVVAGIQFSIQGSAGFAVDNILKSDRIASQEWVLQYNRTDDSTLTVVVLDMQDQGLLPGSGPVATIELGSVQAGTGDPSALTLVNVVVAGAEGSGLGVSVSKNIASSTPQLLNYPNPFNPTTKIAYSVPEPGMVRLTIYDIVGREVRRLVDQEQTPGQYTVAWDARNSQGSSVASGIYIYQLLINGSQTTKKMQLQR